MGIVFKIMRLEHYFKTAGHARGAHTHTHMHSKRVNDNEIGDAGIKVRYLCLHVACGWTRGLLCYKLA